MPVHKKIGIEFDKNGYPLVYLYTVENGRLIKKQFIRKGLQIILTYNPKFFIEDQKKPRYRKNLKNLHRTFIKVIKGLGYIPIVKKSYKIDEDFIIKMPYSSESDKKIIHRNITDDFAIMWLNI